MIADIGENKQIGTSHGFGDQSLSFTASEPVTGGI